MKDLLNKIYSSSTNMIIFYSILGIIALIFIILIIITILKGKKEGKQERIVKKFDVSSDSENESTFTKQINEEVSKENVEPSKEEVTPLKSDDNKFSEIVKESSIERDLLSNTMEMNKVEENTKPINEEKTEVQDIPETVSTPNPNNTQLTNELLKERLDKLKKQRKENNNLNNLDDIMKSVGLDDTPKLDNESETLGK